MVDAPASAAAVAVSADRSGRLSPRARRVLLVVCGALIAAGSVAAFYLVATSLDERVRVVVAASEISAGQVMAAADLDSALVHPGAVVHLRWGESSRSRLTGLVAAHDIAAGTMIGPAMLMEPEQAPSGMLRLDVPIDDGLAAGGVADGDLVLLVDPGTGCSTGALGRPRRVVRPFEVSGYSGSQMSLELTPEEWQVWRLRLRSAGGVFEVVPVPLGAEVEDLADRLDAVWAADWSDEHAEALSRRSGPGPGELEVRVRFDESLAASGVSEGDRVLVVDPGAEPTAEDSGRPRSVLTEMVLERYDGGVASLFVAADEWLWWHSLVDSLGAEPMVLPVAADADSAALAESLDAGWQRRWNDAVDACIAAETARC